MHGGTIKIINTNVTIKKFNFLVHRNVQTLPKC